jgi:hypothetical protein
MPIAVGRLPCPTGTRQASEIVSHLARQGRTLGIQQRLVAITDNRVTLDEGM